MANRDELAVIRSARAGDANAQLVLGKLYLEGSASLAQNHITALYWLDRAARQGVSEAWILIGRSIPFEAVWHSEAPLQMSAWYLRAFEDGVMASGLVYVQLMLAQPEAILTPGLRANVMSILAQVAESGLPQAQWLLAQQEKSNPDPETGAILPQVWAQRAADAGVQEAQLALMEQAWDAQDYSAFLRWALPQAQSLMAQLIRSESVASSEQLMLLVRSARALDGLTEADREELVDVVDKQQLWEVAALHGAREAQVCLGLMYARMDAGGARSGVGSANFKKAVRWLKLAGEQGSSDAWFALSRIYLKSEFSQRNAGEAQAWLELAANLGHGLAQWECGCAMWRNRREEEGNDVKAVLWLHQAALQGVSQAQALLEKITPPPKALAWAVQAKALLSREMASRHAFLAARLELAWLFGLTRAEALLIDIHRADHGHCLVLDIREHFGRSKRRLILLRTGQERQLLDRVSRVFLDVDCGPGGPEGNYRQRVYRLKTLLPQLAQDDLAEAA